MGIPLKKLMKQLLIVTELFHPSMGGQEVRYLELGGLFVQNGWTVDVLTIGFDESPEREVVNGMTVQRLVRTDSYKRPDAKMRRDPGAIMKFAFAVRNHLSAHHYDAVVYNIWPLLPQVLCGNPKGSVSVVDWCEHRSGMFWKAMNILQARSMNKHISVSESLKDVLRSQYSIKDIECIPSGIFTKDYYCPAEKSGVLFFGRLSLHKRPEEAIQAMMLARDAGYKEHLTVAGGGPLLGELKAKYGHLEYIKILGRVSDEEKISLLATHKLHVLPSIREGFPRTVAEAMASGTPTITTNHPDNGTVGVVNQYSAGIVVEPGPEAVAAGILRLVNSPEELNFYKESGLRRSPELDWQQVYEKLVTHLFA